MSCSAGILVPIFHPCTEVFLAEEYWQGGEFADMAGVITVVMSISAEVFRLWAAFHKKCGMTDSKSSDRQAVVD